MALFTPDPVSIPVTESSQVGEARRLGVAMAEGLGFGDTARGEIAIVLTEIATNLVRHARSGEVLLRSMPLVNCCGLEVVGLDRGPGIPNLAHARRDGFTTGSTPGTGLGAVGRLATGLDIFTSETHGTAVLAQFRPDGASHPAGTEVGWVCLPKRGEAACGDACDVIEIGGGRTVVLIADGLGHGMQAAEASRRAIQLFRENADVGGPRLMEILHAALRSTRGAAVTVADLHRGTGELRFTGVGNVTGRLLNGTASRGMITQNGTVGAEMRRVQEFVYPWTPGTTLVIHSDGLTSQWQLGVYAGLAARHASLIAAVLYRDFRRERDDVTVLVLKDRV